MKVLGKDENNFINALPMTSPIGKMLFDSPDLIYNYIIDIQTVHIGPARGHSLKFQNPVRIKRKSRP